MFRTFTQNQFNLIWYVVPNLVLRGSTVLLLPVYSRLLAPEEYGLVGVALVVSGLLRLGILLNLENLYFRFVFGKFLKEDSVEQVSLGVMVRFHLMILFLLLPVLCIPGYFLVTRFASNVPFLFLLLALSSLFLGSLQTPMHAWLRANKKIKSLARLLILGFVAESLLILLGLIHFHWGAVSLLAGQVFGGLVLSPFFLPHFVHGMREKICWRGALLFYRKSLAFGPSTLAICGFTIADRFLLNYFRGPRDTGIYIAAYQLVSIVVAAIFLFNQQWQDLTFQSRKQESINLSKIFLGSIDLFLCAAALLAVLAEPISNYYFGEKFREAGKLLPLLAIIGFLRVPQCFFENIGLADLRRALLVKTNIFSLGLFLLLCFTLIPEWGSRGAIWAGIISLITYPATMYWNQLVTLDGGLKEWFLTNWLPLGIWGWTLLGPPTSEVALVLSLLLVACLIKRFMRYFSFLKFYSGEVAYSV